MKIRKLTLFCQSISMLLVSLSTAAATVSVTGGFTSFTTGFVFANNVPGTIDMPGVIQVLNGQPLCATAGCDADGPASVTFTSPVSRVEFFNGGVFLSGSPPSFLNAANIVEFVAAAPQTVNAIGDNFLIGTLSFTNGLWSNRQAQFAITLKTTSSDPAFSNKVLDDVLFMQVTPNDFVNNSPNQNADFVYLVNNPTLGSVRAFELRDSPTGTSTITVDVFAKIGSLVPTDFLNARGAGFIDPGIAIAPSAVPIPGAAWLMLTALAGLSATQVRRRIAPRN